MGPLGSTLFSLPAAQPLAGWGFCIHFLIAWLLVILLSQAMLECTPLKAQLCDRASVFLWAGLLESRVAEMQWALCFPVRKLER